MLVTEIQYGQCRDTFFHVICLVKLPIICCVLANHAKIIAYVHYATACKKIHQLVTHQISLCIILTAQWGVSHRTTGERKGILVSVVGL